MPLTLNAYPDVVTRDEWLEARKKLLAREREVTHLRDAVNAQRRRLPMVKVDKDYSFEGPDGAVTLLDLFEGRSQLYIHHFMWIDAIERNSQILWIEGRQATSDTGVSGDGSGVMSTGRSRSLPWWNTAPARTNATRCGALTARHRDCAASISL